MTVELRPVRLEAVLLVVLLVGQTGNQVTGLCGGREIVDWSTAPVPPADGRGFTMNWNNLYLCDARTVAAWSAP
ncbi:MAG: hypothetical protein NZO58_02870 [Gemmataceae bacterium]|nr:hypothetical protein [Gemmataceae bacterium]